MTFNKNNASNNVYTICNLSQAYSVFAKEKGDETIGLGPTSAISAFATKPPVKPCASNENNSSSDITSSSSSSVRFPTTERCSNILRSSLRLSYSFQRKSRAHTTSPAKSFSMREKVVNRVDSLEKNPQSASPIPQAENQSNFVRHSFATASFTRPMCRICHDCSGYNGPPIPNMPTSYNASSISLSSSRTTLGSNHGAADESEQFGKLINPCLCDGSLKYIHEVCIQQWIAVSHSKQCELCHYEFEMRDVTKPFFKWKNLPLAKMERRRLLCSVIFHVMALICVVWSLYVLIDRIIDDMTNQQMSWQFWTKLVVVAIGLCGGLVFSYVQFRLYCELVIRWRNHNRVFLVQVPSEETLKIARNKRAATTTLTTTVTRSNHQSTHRRRRDSDEGGMATTDDTVTTITMVPESDEQVPVTAIP